MKKGAEAVNEAGTSEEAGDADADVAVAIESKMDDDAAVDDEDDADTRGDVALMEEEEGR